MMLKQTIHASLTNSKLAVYACNRWNDLDVPQMSWIGEAAEIRFYLSNPATPADRAAAEAFLIGFISGYQFAGANPRKPR